MVLSTPSHQCPLPSYPPFNTPSPPLIHPATPPHQLLVGFAINNLNVFEVDLVNMLLGSLFDEVKEI